MDKNNEYISREAAISKIRDEGVLGGDYDAYEREEDVVDTLNSIPAADAIESLKHTVEILCGVKINLVRCCECVYHDDESQYHYCRKWRRNCPNDSDFFCKWGKRMDGGQDE